MNQNSTMQQRRKNNNKPKPYPQIQKIYNIQRLKRKEIIHANQKGHVWQHFLEENFHFSLDHPALPCLITPFLYSIPRFHPSLVPHYCRSVGSLLPLRTYHFRETYGWVLNINLSFPSITSSLSGQIKPSFCPSLSASLSLPMPEFLSVLFY